MKYLSLFVVLIFLSGCGSNDHIHSATSPDGKYLAMAFFHNTITSKETHVSMIEAEGGFRYVDGNVLILEGNIPVWLEWEGNNSITVEIHGRYTELLKNESINGISISYAKKFNNCVVCDSALNAPRPLRNRYMPSKI